MLEDSEFKLRIMKNDFPEKSHHHENGVESDPSIYQEEDSNEDDSELDSDFGDGEEEEEESDYMLDIRRPIYESEDDRKIKEFFCGRNHDILEYDYPFFNKKFTCVEDMGSSLKYLRMTNRFLL